MKSIEYGIDQSLLYSYNILYNGECCHIVCILYIVANCYRLNMVEWQPSYVYTIVKTHACLLKGTNPCL